MASSIIHLAFFACILHRIHVTYSASATSYQIPRFIVEPQSSIVRPGTALTLTCAVQPEATGVNIRWMVNGTFLTSSSPNRKRGGSGSGIVEGRDGTLRISSYVGSNPQQLSDGNGTSTHDGVYQCVASSPSGTIISAEATLETAYLGQFNISATARSAGALEISVMSSNVAVVPCLGLPPSRPTAAIEFEFNGARIAPLGRYTVLSSGSLMVANITEADAGTYHCVAYNSVVGSRVKSPLAHKLKVIDVTDLRPSQPVFSWSSADSVSVVQGHNLTLECAARGLPVPDISWEKYGGHLPAGRHALILGNLFINGVQKFDAGTYLCKASNGIGQMQSKVISVDVIEPPVIETAPSDQNATEGSTVVFKCRAQGSPRINTQWFFNGQPIVNGQFISIRDPSLTLSNLQRRQSGIYQCVVRNSVGMANPAARLLVVENLSPGGGNAPGGPAQPGVTVRPPAGGSGTGNRPDSGNAEDEYGEDEWDDDNDDDYFDEVVPPGGARRDQNRKPDDTRPGRRKDGGSQEGAAGRPDNGEGRQLATPSRPDVTRVSDTSVRLQWSVVLPSSSGQSASSSSTSISMFKVQYRDVDDRTMTVWNTVDDDIPVTQRAYDVIRLRPGATYRFRVVAVFTNHDNQHGPTSMKITLGTTSEHRAKTSIAGPTIVEARPLSMSEIFIGWQQQDSDLWPIEGFYIYYAPYNEEGLEYQRQVVLGANVRHAVLSHLAPGTSYSIRVQSYSLTGTTSEHSSTVVKQTLAYPNESPADSGNIQRSTTGKGGSRQKAGGDTRRTDGELTPYSPEGATRSVNNDSQILYIVLSVVAGLVALVIVASAIMCIWKKRQRQRNLAAKEQNMRDLHADQTTAFLNGMGGTFKGVQLSENCGVGGRGADYNKFKSNGSHLPGCAGSCAAPGVQVNGRSTMCESSDNNCMQPRSNSKKMAPELVLPPPPPLPPLPPALQASSVYNQSIHGLDQQACSVAPLNQQSLPLSSGNSNGNCPIYSKLLDDSMSSFDDRLPVPGSHFGMPAPPSSCADHIPRSHEAHPYWVLEHTAQQPQQQSTTSSSTAPTYRDPGVNEDSRRMAATGDRWRHQPNSVVPTSQTSSLHQGMADCNRLNQSNYGGGAYRGRRPIDCDSLTTSATSPADSCESLESSDVFSVAASGTAVGAYSDDVDSIRDSVLAANGDTLRSDYENIGSHGGGPRPGWPPHPSYGHGVPVGDSWKTLADRVSGGGYQIRNPQPIIGTGVYGVCRPGVGSDLRVNDYPPADIDEYR